MGRSGGYAELLSAAQQREDEARAAFQQYDEDRSGTIDFEEMRHVLADLGMLDGLPPGQVGTFLEEEFQKADLNGDGVLSFAEFTGYYNSLERLKEVHNADGGVMNNLQDAFLAFCNFGAQGTKIQDMDGPKWAKFCRDTGLQNKKNFTSVQVDLVFSKAKPKGERRINFECFKAALGMVAEMKGMGFEMLSQLVAAKAPASSGTKAEAVKFHDDKSMYTGAHASTVGRDNSRTTKDAQAEFAKRPTPKDVPGLQECYDAFCSFGGGKAGPKGYEMDNAKFAKLARECELLDKKCTSTSIDIIFSKAKPKGERKIMYKSFLVALDLVAAEKGMTFDEMAQVILSKGGPASSGTKADSVKFHDDKSMYTGAYGANVGQAAKVRERGPAANERAPPPPVPGLEEVFEAFATFGGGQAGSLDNAKFAKLCNDCGLINKQFTATNADIIFSKAKPKGERRITFRSFLIALDLVAEHKNTAYETVAGQVVSAGGPASSGTKAEAVRFHDDKSLYTGAYGANVGREADVRVRTAWREGKAPPPDKSGLKDLFTAFCSFGGHDPTFMDNPIWNKFCTETGLYDRKFNSNAGDVVFTKAKPQGERKMVYEDFRLGLLAVSEEKGTSYDAIAAQVLASGGPASSGTQADAVRFHDDKSLYTGAYGANVGREADVRVRTAWREGKTPQDVPGMKGLFGAFCSFGGGNPEAMDSAHFLKVCKECDLIDKKFPLQAVDAVFAKAKEQSSRTLAYGDFLLALEAISEEKGTSYSAITSQVLNSDGPASSGTVADAVKFHDDKSLYTGMHKGK
eukprot:CAMPEP_0183819806 /NCGR_PEP_ID=MMETSP0803_2-20130417/64325_1 /TAXON_ID=195967 /ORGANISM="Crustomastix stigmata, Strain CCMP3273" /LENGTH=798 /DNA_ID=CAMNT_0026064695 /DNA_START=85 /DNA_END=2481 /DNA_ORIENTATION=-